VVALARRLRAAGVGPESRVALALERSPRMVASLLAVLAAGGAYVPLDPASPVERLAAILRDVGHDGWCQAGAAALLTGGAPAAARQAAGLAGVPVVDLDELWPAVERESAGIAIGEPFAAADADREGLAYVIYTSG